MVIWLIGLSGAGKSHIGRAVYRQWKAEERATVFIDGDEIRAVFGADRGDDAYTLAGRRRNAERIRELCALLDRQDINVVCCILSIFEESHEWNRANLRRYFEVFVEAPMEALVARNPKDLYRRARNGEITDVVGVDIPFTPPARPDLVIENGVNFVDAETAARQILTAAKEKFGA